MGIIVEVWEPSEAAPVPARLEEALAQAGSARAQPRSARLAALREVLLDRYPRTGADAPHACAWAGDGLAHEPAGAAWEIAIAPAHAAQVRPFVIAQALRLGLHAHDVQARTVHLAGALPGEGGPADGCIADDPQAAACVEALAALGQGDQREAHAILVRLAAAGNARARWHLGELYDEGGFVQCNAVIACALFCAATGWTALEGAFGAPADATAAERQHRAQAYRDRLGAAIAGVADALMQRLLAPGAFEATLREAGGERDARFAAALAAIDQGERAEAAALLAPLAERGHTHAQRALVQLWAEGLPADDPAREIDWTRAAAQAGDDAAMARMAAFHEAGERLARDLAEAVQWQRRIAREGRSGAVRAAALAALARLEAAPAPDPAALRALAEAGDAGAAFALGCACREGRGGEAADNGAALHWFHLAAERGHAEAQVELAFLHDTGVGVPQDAAAATHWYALAAEQGHVFAQCRYALRLAEGIGVERDRRRMVHWLAQAARQRDGEALQLLARVLAGGIGVRRDPVGAQALFVLAGRHGAPQPTFFGAGEADPRAVRRLLELIDGGTDLVAALGLAQLPATRTDAGPEARTSADGAAAAPSIRPAFRRESDEAVLARYEADRRARQAACAAAIRAAVPAFLGSLALVACLPHFLDSMPGTVPEVLWLAASGLAGWAVARVNRARGITRARLTHAAVVFTPVFGQMFAALWLYRSWRAIQ
jgi:TPR repeat protein